MGTRGLAAAAFAFVTMGTAVACSAVLGIHDIDQPPGGTADTAPDVSTSDALGVDARFEAAVDASMTPEAEVSTAPAVRELGRGSSDHACVVMSDGSVWCWGDNSVGQLATGVAGAYSATPAPVVGLPANVKVAHVTLGNGSTCVVTTDGDVYCWGMSLAGGNSTTPVRVAVKGVASVVRTGPNDSCAVLQNGEVDCWGTNQASELGCDGDAGFDASYCASGSGNNEGTVSVVRTLQAQHAIDVAIGGYVACTITGGNGVADCIGDDSVGYLGDGKTYPHDVCCDVVPNAQVSTWPLISLEAMELYTCAHDNSGGYFCWGDNESCAIYGLPCPQQINAVPVPTLIQLPNIAVLAPGWQHGCASLNNGNEVDCWGWNAHGELGIGSTGYGEIVTQATPVQGLTPPIADVAGHRHFTCALETSGRLLCWGQNDKGQVGNGNAGADVLTPVPVMIP